MRATGCCPLTTATHHIMGFTNATRTANAVLLAYLLRGVGGRDIGKEIKSRASVKTEKVAGDTYRTVIANMRNHLFQDGKAVDLKLLCVRMMINQVTDAATVSRIMAKAKFKRSAAEAYLDVISDPLLLHGVTGALQVLKNPEVRKQLVLSPKQLRAEATSEFIKGKMNPYIAAAVRRKLRFIVTSNNLDYTDFEQELLIRAYSFYMFVRPYLTKAHALNYARRAVASGLQEIISHYTSPDRARLVATDGGWENKAMPLDAFLAEEGRYTVAAQDLGIYTPMLTSGHAKAEISAAYH